MDTITLNPYIFFKGNCRAAMEFYKAIFGGELTVQSYEEVPGETPAGLEGQLMHAALTGGDISLMASDTLLASPLAAKVSLSLGGTNEAKLTRIFNALCQDVEVRSPLKKEFWGDIFGSVTDKYGIEWMVNISASQEQK